MYEAGVDENFKYLNISAKFIKNRGGKCIKFKSCDAT